MNVACDTSLAYQAATASKTYLCDVPQSTAAGLLDPSLALSCNTTRIDGLPPMPLGPGGPLLDFGPADPAQPRGGFCRSVF